MFTLSSETSLFTNCKNLHPVIKAINALQKDLSCIFGTGLIQMNKRAQNQIQIIREEGFESETFLIQTQNEMDSIIISGSDDLGIIYGIYYFTEHILGVDPFAFWTDFEYPLRSTIKIPSVNYRSEPIHPQFRGWFINDEDCLMAWDDSITITNALWEQIFESILRAGYNTVIPGTGTSPHDSQLDIANSCGLWIAQHHAEPLGASMFHDVYPHITARLPEEKDKFELLYRDAVEKSLHRKVIWTVGFRGQGDRAFYEDDSKYDTAAKRGKLIEEMILLQKKIVNEMTDKRQFFLHYLYSESGELYRSGDLHLSDDIIRVYSDNGFGGMRVRRDLFKSEPGVSSLPIREDREKKIGVYYHVSFHDLLISNKLTPLVHPRTMVENLTPFDEAPEFVFIICNVSNIRPHIFNINILRSLWNKKDGQSLKERMSDSIERWLTLHFPRFESEVHTLLMDYFDTPFSYNDAYSDARAGEQVYHHGLRRMIRGLIREEKTDQWFTYIPEHFETEEQCYLWLLKRASNSLDSWRKLNIKADKLTKLMTGHSREFFNDNLAMHIRYMTFSCEGFSCGTQAVLSYKKGNFREAFELFYKSGNFMQKVLNCLLQGEHGKWKNFYRGDWLTGTRETIRYINTMIDLCRIKGEDLVVNSSWMVESLNLTETAISILPQSITSNINLAESLTNKQLNQMEKSDLSILKNIDI